MKKILMLSAAVLALQAIPALAQEHGDKGARGAKMFEKQDTNGDGVITEEEFVARAKEHFTMMDGNKDGKVTKEESEAAFAKMREKMKEHRKDKEGAAPEAAPVAPPAAQ
jgi:Ca2+-binding EF-hand superfamily protein